MKRRSLIASIGVAAAGGAVIGTGAFTTAEAERTLNIEVADEDSAILALSRIEENDSGEFVQPLGSQNEISFDFNNTQGTEFDGRGPGTASTYRFDRLFAVENQGAQPVYFESEFADRDSRDQDLENIGMYVEETDDDGSLLDGENAVLELAVGDVAQLGFKIDTSGVDVELEDQGYQFNLMSTVTTTDEEPDDVTILDTDGEEVNGGVG